MTLLELDAHLKWYDIGTAYDVRRHPFCEFFTYFTWQLASDSHRSCKSWMHIWSRQSEISSLHADFGVRDLKARRIMIIVNSSTCSPVYRDQVQSLAEKYSEGSGYCYSLQSEPFNFFQRFNFSVARFWSVNLLPRAPGLGTFTWPKEPGDTGMRATSDGKLTWISNMYFVMSG